MTINVGVIGLGNMGSSHLDRLANRISGVRLNGICDLKKELTDKYSKMYDVKVYDNAMDLIDSPDIDAVVVVTLEGNQEEQHRTHVPFVLEAIKQKKYVFCEKPIADTADDAMRVIDAEVKLGKRYTQIGFMRRFDPSYIELKREIDSGRYGEPLLVHATHRNETVDETYDTPMAIADTAVHETDILHWLLNDDYEFGSTFLPKKQTRYTHKNLHDPQVITIDTKSGVHVDLEVFVNNQMGYDINCEVVCEKGVLRLETPHYTSVKTNLHQEEYIPEEYTERFKTAYDTEMQEWANGINEDRAVGPSAWDGLISMTTVDALHKSRNEGGIKEAITLPIDRPELYSED
ncbi:Gfo/Idh/MocA family protein [Furfurilactobacillus milii]|nr:Gfo/Idh/MocA family oxidoreductase [Furfurilactobacillus milii]